MSDDPATPDDERPPQPISLESLTSAFAEMMGEKDEAAAEEPHDDSVEETEENTELSQLGQQDATLVTPQSVLEAMLFVGDPENRGLTAVQLAEQIRGVEPDDIESLVESLNEEYGQQHAAMEIVRHECGYRMQLRPDYHRVRDLFYGKTKEAKLSQQAIEVLALVAYNQPIEGNHVSELRGRPSGSLLNQLVRRQLIALERTEEKPRRTLYNTTDRFLNLFGLGSLEELPHSPEFED